MNGPEHVDDKQGGDEQGGDAPCHMDEFAELFGLDDQPESERDGDQSG